MTELYKELMNAAETMDSISETAEKDNDPSFVPQIQKQKMILKYVADGVKKMQDEMNALKRQNQEVKRVAFYELLRQADPTIIEKVKAIAGEQEFDWRCEHQLFSEEEINAVMAEVMKEGKGNEDVE